MWTRRRWLANGNCLSPESDKSDKVKVSVVGKSPPLLYVYTGLYSSLEVCNDYYQMYRAKKEWNMFDN
jgi:hypothetical protein